MKEIAFTVESFTEAERLLLAIGMQVKSNQEKKRELWRLEDVEFMIDTWPWIPTFLEIEGESEQDVRKAATALNMDWQNAIFGGVARIYKHYLTLSTRKLIAVQR
jgi:adenylate cyclase class 2